MCTSEQSQVCLKYENTDIMLLHSVLNQVLSYENENIICY